MTDGGASNQPEKEERLMKRPLVLIGAAGLVSVLLTLALQAQEKQASTPDSSAVAPSAAASGTVAYTFSDEPQMREFAQMWTRRQAALTRMAVLQGYLNQEQAALAQLSQELLSKYNLDVQKNYSLDTERKVLLERPPEAPDAQAPDQAAIAPVSPPNP